MSVPYDSSTTAPPVNDTPTKTGARSCKDCIHKKVCEARRTLYRSFKQFDNEFGDFIDIGVIHNEKDSVIDLLAKSCKHYKSPTTDIGGR